MKGITMRRITILLAGMLIAGMTLAEESMTFKGLFTWNSRKEDNQTLTAEVQPQADGTLSISYTAMWKGKPHAYVGTLTGDLKNGKISGAAVTKGGTRNWVLRGKAEDGVITCDHYEIKGSGENMREVHTGTVTLRQE